MADQPIQSEEVEVPAGRFDLTDEQIAELPVADIDQFGADQAPVPSVEDVCHAIVTAFDVADVYAREHAGRVPSIVKTKLEEAFLWATCLTEGKAL